MPKKKRDTLNYSSGRKLWASRNRKGQFKDIINPSRAMRKDRQTPYRYKTGWDRKPSKKTKKK